MNYRELQKRCMIYRKNAGPRDDVFSCKTSYITLYKEAYSRGLIKESESVPSDLKVSSYLSSLNRKDLKDVYRFFEASKRHTRIYRPENIDALAITLLELPPWKITTLVTATKEPEVFYQALYTDQYPVLYRLISELDHKRYLGVLYDDVRPKRTRRSRDSSSYWEHLYYETYALMSSKRATKALTMVVRNIYFAEEIDRKMRLRWLRHLSPFPFLFVLLSHRCEVLVLYLIEIDSPHYQYIERLKWHMKRDITLVTGVSILSLLLERGIDPTSGDNALTSHALQEGYIPILKVLLNDGRANMVSPSSYSLMEAAGRGHLEIVKAVLEDGRYSKYIYHCIEQAAIDHQFEVIKWILTRFGVGPGIIEECLHAAVCAPNLEVLSILLPCRSKYRTARGFQMRQMMSYITRSIWKNEDKVLKLLFASLDPGEVEEALRDRDYHSLQRGNGKSLPLLLNHIDSLDVTKKLMKQACWMGRIEQFRVLIDYGCAVLPEDVEIARTRGHKDLLVLINKLER